MSRFRSEVITRPETALPLVYAIFVLLAALSFKLDVTRKYIIAPTGAFQEPGPMVYIITIIGIAILSASAFVGTQLSARLRPTWVMPIISLLAFVAITRGTPLPTPIAVSVALSYPVLLLIVSRRLSDIAYLSKIAYALALGFSASILVRGIPILSSAGRASTAVDPSRALFHGFAVFAGTLLMAGQKRSWASAGVLSLVGFGIISGFKSDAVAVILSAVLAGLLLEKISAKEIVASLAVVLVILTGVSTLIALVSYENWKIPPALYIVYRAGFTFAAFGKIVETSFPFGYLKGAALLDPTQRILSSTLLSQYYPEPHIITSTLLGPGMLDFGLIGVALSAAVVGVYLGYMNRLRQDALGSCLYAVALTHSFILVEVGLQLTSVLFFLSLLYLMLARRER